MPYLSRLAHVRVPVTQKSMHAGLSGVPVPVTNSVLTKGGNFPSLISSLIVLAEKIPAGRATVPSNHDAPGLCSISSGVTWVRRQWCDFV